MSRLQKAWLVDLDGTLYRAKPIRWRMGAELILRGPFSIPLLSRFRQAHEELREELRANPELSFEPNPFEQQLSRTAASLGTSPEKVRAVVMDWMVRRPAKKLSSVRRDPLIREIRDFHDQAGKTALVSDYPAQEKLSALGLVDLFDVVIASGETDGLTRLKPCPDSYLLAAERLAVQPKDCLVIGDRDDADGAAARRAKMSFRLIS